MPQQHSFEQATEISEQLVPLYRKLQKDVQTMVQREVAEVAARSERDIRHALGDLARGGAGGIRLPQWSWKVWSGLATTAALAVLLMMRPPSWPLSNPFSNAPAVSTAADGTAEQPDGVVPAAPGDQREESFATQAVARYNRLFDTASPRFNALLVQIRKENRSQELEANLQLWERRDTTTAVKDRVHAAFVQAVLKKQIANLAIDGDITRTPSCAGQSCRAVQALWEQDQKGDHALPAFQTPLRKEDLITIEKFMVYNHLPPRDE